MEDKLTLDEQRMLLQLARDALEHGVKGAKLPPLDQLSLPPHLREDGASFVTLTLNGQLRGCIGALEPYQSLSQDVREHAVAAAREDPRFPAVTPDELNGIQIDVSRLTRPIPLEYKDADDLLQKLKPNVHGVILKDGYHRSTFLPQVWEKIPDPAEFLNNLCYKMGVNPDLWRRKHLDVLTYQVEDVKE